ncbi:hypothetical protein B0H14DRAFT_3534424 [Mycena olivaceomarginata]|nr:hypothetical protein B0H14DRAFT_3534424 [Mycena olivaceomarginata]
MSQQHEICSPIYRPSLGDEDHARHSSNAHCRFYTVGVGFEIGIYTDEYYFFILLQYRQSISDFKRYIARQQVEGFSNGRWKSAKTYHGACQIWELMCERYHDHGDTKSPSSPVQSPPPSPTPVPRSPPARRARHASLPPAARPVTPLAKSLPPPTRSWATPPPVPISPARVARAPPRPRISLVSSTRHPGEWTIGDILWGIEGTLLLFEDRYDVVDHIHLNRLSSARLMQSRDRRLLEVFVGNGAYGTEDNAV